MMDPNQCPYSILQAEEILAMVFDCVKEAESFYRKFAVGVGFSIYRQDSYRNTKGEFIMLKLVCNKEGLQRKEHMERVQYERGKRPVTRVGCPASFKVSLVGGKWVVKHIHNEHNHDLATPNEVCFLKSHYEIPEHCKMEIRTMFFSGMRVRDIVQYFTERAGGLRNVGFRISDLYNFINMDRTATIVDGDAEAAIAFLAGQNENDLGLCYKTKVVDGTLRRLFWADSDSQFDYACFGDIIMVDSTYKTNAYNMPLIVLVGVNHHHQSIIFGIALLDEETLDAYTWLFETFMAAMNGKQPKSIVTDGDKAMRGAIAVVFPQTRHRLCAWHLERNAMSNIHDATFLADFKECMFSNISVIQFEVVWHKMVERHKLQENEWIQ